MAQAGARRAGGWEQGRLEAVSAQHYTEKRGGDGCLSRELDGDHWDPQGSAKVELFCGWVQASSLSPWVGCPTTSIGKVLEQTLSPLWDELLVFEQLTMNGRREHLQEAPPMVTINVFDHKFGHEDPPEEQGEEEDGPEGPQRQKSMKLFLAGVGMPRWLLKAPLKKLSPGGLLNQGPALEDIPDPEELDWWSKYYA
ncbi:Fer-1-Like Protein 4 [Manis pentadactyla]|nr:Fer-1-Like Protein 4 [Manis pentadactyla]